MTLEKCPIAGSSIYEFNLHSSFEIDKKWYAPVTCRKEEIISDLKYNSSFLTIPIFNKHIEQSHFELCSVTTLDCI